MHFVFVELKTQMFFFYLTEFGLGFSDLCILNLAMFAYMLCRILLFPETLCATIFLLEEAYWK